MQERQSAVDPIDDIIGKLESAGYIADPGIATTLYMAQILERPVLIEGKAGVGKTEIANVMSRVLGTKLIRLQCYDGLDVNTILYEWNYPKQLLRIKLGENSDQSLYEREQEIFSEAFLLKRPLLEALTQNNKAPVLLIDEVDRADEEFEAYLLETLSEFQITIPEIGTISAIHKPLVILTSNRTRELSDALRRRCLYLWIDYPDYEKELRIIRSKISGINYDFASQISHFIQKVREMDLEKMPGISETLDWANAMILLQFNSLDYNVVEKTLGAFIKDADDIHKFRTEGIKTILSNM